MRALVTVVIASLIVHTIGRGPELEDMLFAYPISGHYRYSGD